MGDCNYEFLDSWESGVVIYGVFNSCIGLLVMGVVGFNSFALVAIINSLAASLSYGLGIIAGASDKTREGSTANIAWQLIADFFWLVQECSLSFYSFLIVRRIVRGRERIIYFTGFWILQTTIVVLRIPIMVTRVTWLKTGKTRTGALEALELRGNSIHMGYFITIALCESWNSVFLLKEFYKAKSFRSRMGNISFSGTGASSSAGSRSSTAKKRVSGSRGSKGTLHGGFYSYLFRSSELRVASLAGIGIMRAIGYSLAEGENRMQHMDDVFKTIEIFFSSVFLFDILASKLAYLQQQVGLANQCAPTDYKPEHGSAEHGEFHPEISKRDEEAAVITEVKPIGNSNSNSKSELD